MRTTPVVGRDSQTTGGIFMDRRKMTGGEKDRRDPYGGLPPGIVIHGRESAVSAPPRIQAFIWGGKLPASPTLPYGRFKGAA